VGVEGGVILRGHISTVGVGRVGVGRVGVGAVYVIKV
jgi:hypothetical protein